MPPLRDPPPIRRLKVHQAFAEHPAFDYAPPAYLAGLKVGLVALALLAACVVVYVLYWMVIARQTRSIAEAWMDGRRAQGDHIAYASSEIGGFPDTVEYRLANAVARTTAFGPGVEWNGELLVIVVNPFAPSRQTFRATGRQKLVIEGDGKPLTLEGAVERAAFTLSSANPWPRFAGLEVDQLDLRAPGGGERVAARRLSAQVRDLEARKIDHVTPTVALRLTAEDIVSPVAAGLPLGPALARLRVDADLLGRLEPGPLTPAFTAWRDSGGTVELYRLEAEYGALDMAADGTLALDQKMQPIGALSARIAGLFETVDRLQAAGHMRARDAITAKFVLGALTKRPEGGGRPMVNVPLTIQDRVFFVGPVRAAEMPELVWPAAPAPATPPPRPAPTRAAMR